MSDYVTEAVNLFLSRFDDMNALLERIAVALEGNEES